ncbi:O-antigen ligase family protein [Flexistipes sinusarabici]|uniref:O-antigen ligase family protein n=1 Tax=Flexistipes sinusarabici TaxID=2352 RepID=UPI0011D1B5A5|nr:O-antigen ligase family protein [Flexistipes sinusarabici]
MIYIAYVFYSNQTVKIKLNLYRFFIYVLILFFLIFLNDDQIYHLSMFLLLALLFEFSISFIDSKTFFYSIILLSFLFLTFSIIEYSLYSNGIYILDSKIAKFVFVGLHEPRRSLIGLFGQQNLSSLILCLGFFGYIHLIEETADLPWYRYIPLAYIAMGIFLTTSRMAIVAICFTFLSMILLKYFQSIKKLSKIIAASVAGYFLSSAIGYSSVEKISSINASGAADVSSYMRFNYWFSSLKMGFDNLPFGVGLGGFKKHLGDYTLKTAETLKLGYSSFDQTLWAHNDFFQFFADTGIFALLVITACIFWFFKIGLFKKYTYLSSFVLVFFIYANFSYPLHFPPLMIIFVISLALIYKEYGNKSPVSSDYHVTKFALIILAGLVIVLNIYFINHFTNNYQYYKFNRNLTNSNVVESAKHFAANHIGENINSPYEWLFINDVIYKFSNYSYFKNKPEIAKIIAPVAVNYSKVNANHTLYYSMAKLFFTMQEYNKAKKYARIAFNKKPNIDQYYTLMHMAEVMMISKRENIPITELMPEDVFLDYESEGVLHESQYDSNLIVK